MTKEIFAKEIEKQKPYATFQQYKLGALYYTTILNVGKGIGTPPILFIIPIDKAEDIAYTGTMDAVSLIPFIVIA